MTTGRDPDRAAEIIAAYGGDETRWPDAERAAVRAAVAADPALARARDDGLRVDALLDEWARGPIAVPAVRKSTPWRWAAGASMAAALAATVMLVIPNTAPLVPTVTTVPTTISDEAAFAVLFTPTPDEETTI